MMQYMDRHCPVDIRSWVSARSMRLDQSFRVPKDLLSMVYINGSRLVNDASGTTCVVLQNLRISSTLY